MTYPDMIMTLPLQGGGEVRVVNSEEILLPDDIPDADAVLSPGQPPFLHNAELALATAAAISKQVEQKEDIAAFAEIATWQTVEQMYREQNMIETETGWTALKRQLERMPAPAPERAEEISATKTGEWDKPLVVDAVAKLTIEEQEGYEAGSLDLDAVIDEHIKRITQIKKSPTMLSAAQGSLALVAINQALLEAVETDDTPSQQSYMAAVGWVMHHTITGVTHIEYPPHLGLGDMTGQSVLAAVQ